MKNGLNSTKGITHNTKISTYDAKIGRQTSKNPTKKQICAAAFTACSSQFVFGLLESMHSAQYIINTMPNAPNAKKTYNTRRKTGQPAKRPQPFSFARSAMSAANISTNPEA